MKRFVLIFWGIVLLVCAYNSCKDGGDFNVFLFAGEQLKNGQNIYIEPFYHGLQYYYSVLFALILSPFSEHVFITEFCWIIISYFLLFRIKCLIISYLDLSTFSKKDKNKWLFFSFFFMLQFVMYEVSMIQVTIFLLWAILESIKLIENKKEISAGILLAFAINIKIMPILIIPYLFYRGNIKTIFSVIISSFFFLYLPGLIIGFNRNAFLMLEWWNVINPSKKEHLFEGGIGTHSIVSWLPVYLIPISGDLPYRRNILELSFQKVELIVNICRVLFFCCSIFYLKSFPFKKEKNKIKVFWEVSYFLILIPLLFPHQQKYCFLMVIPMMTYLTYFFIYQQQHNNLKSYSVMFSFFILCSLFFSPFYGSDVIGIFLFKYTQHFRLLTFATIGIIIVSIFCSPLKLSINKK